MLPDKHLRQPPEVEDQSILGYSFSLQAGCCSVHSSSELALCCNDLQYNRFALHLEDLCCSVRTLITQVCNMWNDKAQAKTVTYCEMCRCRAVGLPYLRYDSVMGTHPHGNTPVYITYHEACGYPTYLVTYTSTAR